MYFQDRAEAGRLLANALQQFKGEDVIVYALPRGGVTPALEIARALHAPLDLVIVRKIGHQFANEWALAAVAEDGHMVANSREVATAEESWFKKEVEYQRREAKRRRELYLEGRPEISAKGKIAILVDDGVATGLTIRLGIEELKHRHPKKIVVAVPVVPEQTARILKKEADELVALDIPADGAFLGAVGAYYDDFLPVEDSEVVDIMRSYAAKGVLAQKPTETEAVVHADPMLFTFPAFDHMLGSMRTIPDVALGSFRIDRFANNELSVELQAFESGQDCIVLGSIAPPDMNLLSYLMLCHTLRKSNAGRITAVLPYLSYTRQEKDESRKSFSTRFVGELLQAAGADDVITVDVHSPQAQRVYPILLSSLSPAKLFAEAIVSLGMEDATIVAPDEGAIPRARAVAQRIATGNRIAYFAKRRLKDEIRHSDLRGSVGRRAVIIDDILDTGGTLLSCCDRLVQHGVQEIVIMVTHGQFTGSAWEALWEKHVKYVYCTDTIPLPPHVSSKAVRVLSVATLLSEKLAEEHELSVLTAEHGELELYDHL